MALHTVNPQILLPLIARKYVSDGERESVYGSTIYKIKRDGICELLSLDPNVRTTITVSQLESALQDENILSILVPDTAAITLSIVRNRLGSIVQKKIVFWEE